jgi:hypothetical protein
VEQGGDHGLAATIPRPVTVSPPLVVPVSSCSQSADRRSRSVPGHCLDAVFSSVGDSTRLNPGQWQITGGRSTPLAVSAAPVRRVLTAHSPSDAVLLEGGAGTDCGCAWCGRTRPGTASRCPAPMSPSPKTRREPKRLPFPGPGPTRGHPFCVFTADPTAGTRPGTARLVETLGELCGGRGNRPRSGIDR